MTEPRQILLVDDEEALLKLMRMYLERLGYAVQGHPTGQAALAAFDAEPDRFELVVADLTLPDFRGEDLAVQMATRNLNLRVLLCSGYPFETSLIPPELRPRFATLQKPFLPDMLAKAVQKLLES